MPSERDRRSGIAHARLCANIHRAMEAFMKQLTHESLGELLAERTGPCIAIYMNPLRGPKQLHENDVRLRSRVEQATDELRQRYGKSETKELTDRILHISQPGFWEQAMMGLGNFCAP